ncbi:MAG: transglycosylase SLT domain-containing protein [bacterium]|nr:transglycosylase SLT domain-containing protein [bacterium]
MMKINNLPAPMEIAPAKTPLDSKLQRQLKLKQATQAFESIFIAQLLKSMRSSSLEDKGKEESGFGKDIMLSMADESVAKQLAKTGMIGIGEVLYNNLLKRLGEETQVSTGLEITSKRHIDGVAPPRSAKEVEPEHFDSHQSKPATSPPIQEKVPTVPQPTNTKVIGPVESQQVTHAPQVNSPAHDRLSKYVDHIRSASIESNIPEDLLRAVIMQESSGNERATSNRGAAGLMQLMPDTARSVGVTNLYDAEENIKGGARYLRQMFDRFGDIESALAAYNAGPGNVEKHNGIPPFAETQNYVKRILSQLSEGKQVNKSSQDTDIKK